MTTEGKWKRPHIEVGATVSFYKFFDSKPKAMIVTEVGEQTIKGAVFGNQGGGFIPMACVYHVDDPELSSRPQMQEAMWRHTEEHRKVNLMWERMGMQESRNAEIQEFSMPEALRSTKEMVEEKDDLAKVASMFYQGCTDKGRICAETGVHHKRVEKYLNQMIEARKAKVSG